jgi:hypothetical protein
MADLDPALLEALREQSGLSIDLEGRFRHRGDLITHARTLEVLWGSLRRGQDGRYLVQVGREQGYVRLEDAPYGVRGITPGQDGPLAHLSDGSIEPLAAASLRLDREGVLHCDVKGGVHRARFTRPAQVALGLELVEDADAPGGYRLDVGGRSYPIGRE